MSCELGLHPADSAAGAWYIGGEPHTAMNSLLVFLVRHDSAASLAAHLMAGIAALLLLFGTSRPDGRRDTVQPSVAQVAPVMRSGERAGAADAKRVDLPIAAVASTHAPQN